MPTVIKADCLRINGRGWAYIFELDEWPNARAGQALSVGGYGPLTVVQYIPMPGTPLNTPTFAVTLPDNIIPPEWFIGKQVEKV
jgi:hypothetical protein